VAVKTKVQNQGKCNDCTINIYNNAENIKALIFYTHKDYSLKVKKKTGKSLCAPDKKDGVLHGTRGPRVEHVGLRA
jgi:hypothetical protein